MKREKGITLVALVVTIIVLIILAGISINLILGDNGVITIAKKAKENTKLAKIEEETELNELETNDSSSDETTYDAIAKLTEFKQKIAKAITDMGIETSETENADKMADNIRSLKNNIDVEQNILVNKKGSNVTTSETFTGYSEYMVCSIGATARVSSFTVVSGTKINLHSGYTVSGFNMYIDKITSTSKNAQVTINYSGGVEGCVIFGIK